MSGTQSTSLSREDLYEQVWSTSILQLAKKFGISDVGLAKACKRHQIPKPPLGYWAKRAAGKVPARPPLPVLVDPKLQTVKLTPLPRRAPRPPGPGDLATAPVPMMTLGDPEIAAAWDRFTQACPEIRVPDTLRAPLPIVAATLAALHRGAKERTGGSGADTQGLVSPYRTENEACLSVVAGRGSLERAARFFNTLIRTFEACGFELEEVREDFRRSVLLAAYGTKYQIRLRELTRREPHESTATDLAEKQRSFYAKTPKWDYVPSGDFSLELLHEKGFQTLRTWEDGTVRRIEDMIAEIVRAVMEESDVAKAARKREWEAMRRQAKEAQARYEAEQRRKELQAQSDLLLREVESWETCQRIRRYVRVVERTAIVRHGKINAGSELDRWMIWARSVADRLDPLVPRPAPPAIAPTSPESG